MDACKVLYTLRISQSKGLSTSSGLQHLLITAQGCQHCCRNSLHTFIYMGLTEPSEQLPWLLVDGGKSRESWHLYCHIFLLVEESTNVARNSWAKQSVRPWLPEDKRKLLHVLNWSGTLFPRQLSNHLGWSTRAAGSRERPHSKAEWVVKRGHTYFPPAISLKSFCFSHSYFRNKENLRNKISFSQNCPAEGVVCVRCL